MLLKSPFPVESNTVFSSKPLRNLGVKTGSYLELQHSDFHEFLLEFWFVDVFEFEQLHERFLSFFVHLKEKPRCITIVVFGRYKWSFIATFSP